MAHPLRLPAFLVAFLAATTLLGASGAEAQDVPVETTTASTAALPDAPDDFVRERRGAVLWEFPSRVRDTAHALQRTYRTEWPRVVDELGQPVEDDLVVRIGRNPAEMRSLAPTRAPPPAYATGVAYPSRGLVLLTLSVPETWERADVHKVFVHELSHIALHRAAGGNPVPRWFSEGVAIYQAHELSMERTRVLWGGTVGDRLLSFERLSRGFPERAHEVNLAYAQSADFVHWLRERRDGERKFRQVIGRLRDGQSFETSLRQTYSANMTRLELDWHESLNQRFQALPLLVGSGGLWVFAAFLVLIAYIRRRRKDRIKHAEWEAEDEELKKERALAAALKVPASRALHPQSHIPSGAHAASGLSPTRPDDDIEVLYVVPAEPRGRDTSVPTVEHDGRNHTLH